MPVRSPLPMVLVLLLSALSALSAQEPAAPPSDEPVAEAAAGPKRAEYDRVFTEWKALLAEMRSLKLEYRTAEAARRTEIEKQYKLLIAKGDAMSPQLIQAALEAYQEAPNTDDELTSFLTGLVNWKCITDDYEEALRLAKVLIENKVANQPVFAWAALAAFTVGDLDAAEKYFKVAEENDSLRVLNSLPMEHQLREIPAAIDDFLAYYKEARAKEQAIRAAEAEADDLPRVLLKTSQGEIEIELFENEAPNTVANFVSLVDKGYYDGLTFHRVLSGFMAQGGCPDGTGGGGPGYNIPCECYQPNHRLHFRGSLSMAKGLPRDTGGSQFFINLVPTRHLDGKHTVFGRVIRGIDVTAKLQRRNSDPRVDPDPPTPDRILEAKVLRKRDHDYVPKKVGEN